MSEYDEYLICKKRGHYSGGGGICEGRTVWQTCRYCETDYHEKLTVELIERNVPEPPGRV